MPIQKLDNADIYYELHGRGKPLILIAGYTCDHSFWLPLVSQLAHTNQVLILDNRGVGHTTDDNASFTIDTLANDVAQLIKQLGLEHSTLIGHSMGGMIVQTLAYRHPDLFEKAIIIASAMKLSIRSRAVFEGLLALRKENVPLEIQVQVGLPWIYSADFVANPDNIKQYVEILKNNPDPMTLQNQQRQLQALLAFDSSAWLSKIKTPTLVIVKEDDLIAPVHDCQQLAAAISSAKLVMISGAHAIENPQDIITAIS